MKSEKYRWGFVVVAVVCLSLFVLHMPAFGATAANNYPFIIEAVTVDLPANTMTIYGQNFIWDSKKLQTPPQVFLAGTPLVLNSYSENQIDAVLPAGITDGGYLIELLAGNTRNSFTTFNLTIGATGATGAQGPQGVQGPQGPQGAAGTNGVSGWEQNYFSYPVNAGGATSWVKVYCSSGKKVLGGGVTVTGYNLFPPTIVENGPEPAYLDTGWYAVVQNNELFVGVTMHVRIMCAYVN